MFKVTVKDLTVVIPQRMMSEMHMCGCGDYHLLFKNKLPHQTSELISGAGDYGTFSIPRSANIPEGTYLFVGKNNFEFVEEEIEMVEDNARLDVLPGALNSLVVNGINTNTNKGVVFTAYDVTVTLRKENPTYEIDHYKVRDIVHEEMKNVVGYTSEAKDMGSGAVAIVYSPTKPTTINSMPTTYTDVASERLKPKDKLTTYTKVTKENRVTIPSTIISKAKTYLSDDRYRVKIGNHSLLGNPRKNKDGRVRVDVKDLKVIPGDRVEVSLDDNKSLIHIQKSW